MDAWGLWLEMARESSQIAQIAEAGSFRRSAASRYYYAAYQAATALLRYRMVPLPEGRQAWSHDLTPALLYEQLEPLLRARHKRKDLQKRLERLYKTRIIADYMANTPVTAESLKSVRRDSNYILKVAEQILPKG